MYGNRSLENGRRPMINFSKIGQWLRPGMIEIVAEPEYFGKGPVKAELAVMPDNSDAQDQKQKRTSEWLDACEFLIDHNCQTCKHQLRCFEMECPSCDILSDALKE